MSENGRYKLNKEPKDYKIGEIIKAADENLDVVTCLKDKNCNKINNCKKYSLWQGLSDEINDYLNSKTLEDYL